MLFWRSGLVIALAATTLVSAGGGPAQAETASVLVRASSVDSVGTERLVAQLEDTNGDGVPSPGDTVRAAEYPKDFTGQSYGSFTQTVHVIDTVTQADSNKMWVREGSLRFLWSHASEGEIYQELDLDNALPTATEIEDAFSESSLRLSERIRVEPASPSAPDSTIGKSEAANASDDDHINIDFAPTDPAAVGVVTITPARLLESRAGKKTVDGKQQGIGKRTAGQVTTVQIAGRAGIPTNADAAIINIGAIAPDNNGYITAFPCDKPQPGASTLNYTAGTTIANGATIKLSTAGTICIYTHQAMHLIIDVTGYTLNIP
jgi:hypothetical protein